MFFKKLATFDKFVITILFALAQNIYGAKLNPAYPLRYLPYYSQNGQDKFLNENIFNGKKNGVFFDIGAHDGISYSNTYYLEKELGWTGICVEPQKKIFEALRQNRKCICLNGCVYDKDGEAEFLQVNGPSEMLSGLVATYEERQLERANSEIAALGGNLETYKVPTFSFNTLCHTHKINHIDLLSVDTEGSEKKILEAIDFDKIDISVIIAESNFVFVDQIDPVRNFLETKGYVFVKYVGQDGIYKKVS